MNRERIVRAGCIAAGFFMAAVLYFGAGEIGRVNHVPHLAHKVEHFFYYGGIAVLLVHGFGRRRWWVALLAVALLGAIDEWHQFYIPLRNASAYDWLTDVVGAGVAVFAYRLVTRKEVTR